MKTNGVHIQVIAKRDKRIIAEIDSLSFSDIDSSTRFTKDVMWPWVDEVAKKKGLARKDVDIAISSTMVPLTLLGSTTL